MAAIDFPSSPAVGQVFTSGSSIWEWDGTAWRVVRNVTNPTYGIAYEKINLGTSTPDYTLYGGSFSQFGILSVKNGGTGASTLTPNNVILGNGGSAVQFVAPSTSGNVLTSNGTTWTSATNAYAGVQAQVFTGNGTFTVPTGITAVKVTVIGGGGNGGSGSSDGSATGSGGGGGGAGVAIKWITGLTPGAAITVTVGTATNTSSFGAYCSATGGTSGSNGSGASSINGLGNGGAGGTGSSGDINLSGGNGLQGTGGYGGSGAGAGGSGAQSGSIVVNNANNIVTYSGYMGASGAGGSASVGGAATGYGNGGGGGSRTLSGTNNGGAGSAGIVIVEY